MFKCNKIFLTLTYKCNALCEKCATRRSVYANDHMNKETLKIILNQLKKYNFKGKLLLGAGETLLYPHLKYFIEQILSINEDISLTIFTNGKLFSPLLPDLYFNSRIHWIITLDGFYQEDISNLQYNLDIESVKRNIQQISNLHNSQSFSLNYTLHNKNIKNLLKYLDFCLNVFPKNIYITKMKIFKEFYNKLKNYDLDLNDSYVNDIFVNAKNFCINHGLEVEFPENKKVLRNNCWNTSKLSPAINYNGDISFCSGREDAPIANITDTNYNAKWQKILEYLKNNKNQNIWCKKCSSNNNSIYK